MQASTAAFATRIGTTDLDVDQRVTLVLPYPRQKNLCPTPSFEYGSGMWQNSGSVGGPMVADTTRSVGGTRSLHLLLPTFTAGQTWAILLPLTDEVVPGQTYTITMQVWLDSTCPPITCADAASTNMSSTVVSTRGSWQTLTVTVLPGDLVPILEVTTTATTSTAAASNGFWLDNIVMVEGTVAAPYFDGDTAGCRWQGIPGASTSVQPTDPYSDVTLAVESVDVERNFVSDAPQGTRLLDGYPTAQATITLSGLVDPMDETKTAAWLFDPDNTASPLWPVEATHALVTVDAGLLLGTGPAELLRQFTGYVDTYDVDANAGTVTFTCYDPYTLFRPTANVPAVAYMSNPTGNNPGLTGGWVIDLLARQNGYNSCPPPRAACLLYASMHGSAWPEVMSAADDYTAILSVNSNLDVMTDDAGNLTGLPGDYLARMVPGMWGSQVVRNPSIIDAPLADFFFTSSAPRPAFATQGSAFYFEAALYGDATQDGTTALSRFVWTSPSGLTPTITVGWQWNVGDAAATMYWQFSGGAPVALAGSLPLNAWHRVGVHVYYTSPSAVLVTVTIDNTVTTTTITGLSTTFNSLVANASFQWLGYAEAVQFTGEISAVPTPLTWQPTAYLDPSLNALIGTVDVTGQNPKDVIQQLAEAERGVAGFDEHGVFRFTNRTNTYGTSSARTIDADVSLKALAQEVGMAAFSNHVQAEADPLVVTGPTLLYQLDHTVAVAPHETTVLTVSVSSGAVLRPVAADSGYNGGAGVPGTTYWRAAKSSGGSTAVTTGILVYVSVVSPSTLQITISNGNPFRVYMVSPSTLHDVPRGVPYLFVGGTQLATGSTVLADSQWPPVESDDIGLGIDLSTGGAGSDSEYAEVLIALSGNPWLQDAATAQGLADDTLADLYQVRPLLTNTSMVLDPRLQLGDRVTFTDADTGMKADAYLVGISTHQSAGDWTQDIDARRLAPPGTWVMGQAGASEMGHTTRV